MLLPMKIVGLSASFHSPSIWPANVLVSCLEIRINLAICVTIPGLPQFKLPMRLSMNLTSGPAMGRCSRSSVKDGLVILENLERLSVLVMIEDFGDSVWA